MQQYLKIVPIGAVLDVKVLSTADGCVYMYEATNNDALHYFLTHNKPLLLCSQLSCCPFPRVPAVSTAPPPSAPHLPRPLAEPPVSRRGEGEGGRGGDH